MVVVTTRGDNPLTGVCPVLEVPFASDEAVDYDSFAQIVSHVAGSGARGMMFPGFASEFYKLSDAERRELPRAMVREASAAPGVVTVAGIPDHATHLAVARACEAVDIGAQAINLLPPYFLGPSPQSVVEHASAVLAAVNPCPVILQYAPNQTGSFVGVEVVRALAADHANLVAVKVESSPPGALIADLRTGEDPLPALVGHAGVQMPDALRRGAVGVQPGCSFVELYVAIWDAWEAGDHAHALLLHQQLLPFISYWMQAIELIVAAEKFTSWRRGLISTPACRRPSHVLDNEEIALVDALLEEFADLIPSIEQTHLMP